MHYSEVCSIFVLYKERNDNNLNLIIMTTLENITRQIKENGFANYKASVIVPSKKLAGWFHNKKETVFAPSLSELIFDLDDEQINIDYDANVKASKELLNAFVNFKEAL